MSDFNIQFEEQDQSITLEFEQIGGGAVKSVNGKTGVVVLDADDVGAYTKPSGGIPKTDLASAVQTSLGKADSAYQKPSGGIPAGDIASGVVPAVDNTLTVSGAAADAKKVGDEISTVKDGLTAVESDVTDLKEDIGDLSELETTAKTDLVSAINEAAQSGGGGLTEDIKQALLQIAEKVAYIDEDGQDYYDALEDALYPPADLVSISCVYTQSGTVYDTDSLDSLKPDLVVTAHMSDQTTRNITNYTLSGTLTVGTSVITVSYGGKTTTFSVTVTQEPPYEFYDYIQSDGTAYIDTGLKAQTYIGSTYEHELKVSHGVNESEKPVYGAREAWGNANARIIWQKNLAYQVAYCGSATGYVLNSETLYDPVVIRTGTDKKVYLNGVEVADYSAGSSGNITKTFNILLCAQANGQQGSGYFAIDGGYASPPSKARLYYFKVRNNDNELIAEMIPARRKSDDAVGMYDTVRDVFFQNARDTGTLTLGND